MRVERRLAICFMLALVLAGGRQSVLAQGEPGVYQTNSGPPPAYNGAYVQAPNGATPYPAAPNAFAPNAAAPNFNGPMAPPGSYNASLGSPEYSNYPQVVPVVPPNMPPGAYGSTINPFPTVSPYDYSFQNDSNVGGIWEHTERTRDRKYYFTSDFLWMSTKPPQGIFGNPSAQTYVRQIRDFLDGSSSSSGSSGSSGGSSGTSTNATSQLLQDQGFITDTPSYFASTANYYNALDLGTEGNLVTVGARFTTGWWNPDNSGVDASFWFGGKATDDFNAMDDITQKPNDMSGLLQIIRFLQNTNAPVTTVDEIARYDTALNTNKLSPSQILEQNLLNLRGLPVADNTARGQTIPYDIYFDVKTTSQQIGTNLDYYFTPIFERKWINIAPSVGVTYLNIHESLSFLGIDSGMLYSPQGGSSSGSSSSTLIANRDWKAQSYPNGIDDSPQDGIIDNAANPESGPSSSTSSSSSSGSSSSSSGTPLFTFPTPFALLPATIDISTSTNLIGPTGGLRYLIGGKSFHLIGETKFGLMANYEQIGLTGNNIGSTTRVNGNVVNFPQELVTKANPNPNTEYQQDLIVPTTQDPNPNAFSSSQTHAHVSPMFVQSIIAEAPVLQYVPVVNKIWPLNAAVFRLGYTFIWVGNVIDTNQSVLYQGDPMAGMFPEIEPQHSTWWTQNGSIGVTWEW